MVCKQVKILDMDLKEFKIKVQGLGETFDLKKHPQGTEIKAITCVHLTPTPVSASCHPAARVRGGGKNWTGFCSLETHQALKSKRRDIFHFACRIRCDPFPVLTTSLPSLARSIYLLCLPAGTATCRSTPVQPPTMSTSSLTSSYLHFLLSWVYSSSFVSFFLRRPYIVLGVNGVGIVPAAGRRQA